MRGWRGHFLDFCLGGLCVFGFAPFHFFYLALAGFAGLMMRLDGVDNTARGKFSGFAHGFWFGFGFFVFGLYWIGSAFIARGGNFIYIMPFAVLALCAGLACFWAVAAAIYVRFRGRNYVRRIGVFAGALWGAEFLRGQVFGGFPWNLPGYVFKPGGPISQIAYYIGIYGLSALVILASASLAVILSARKFTPAITMSLIFTGIFMWGHHRLAQANITYVPGVKLRLVHANIPQKDKFDPNKYVEIANTYIRLTLSDGFEDATHVVWPEGALPGFVLENQHLMRALETLFVENSKTPPVFITQTLRRDVDKKTHKTRYFNSVAVVKFSKNRPPEISPYYDKQKLVPFGEFIPLGQWIDKLGIPSLSTAVESISPGRSGTVPVLPGLPPASIQICYEILFPHFTPRTLQPSGAQPQWILNLSNDSWYGDSSGPRQQSDHAAYRAIETGLPVVRSTVGGITAVIDPYGRKLKWRNLNDSGVLDMQIPTYLP